MAMAISSLLVAGVLAMGPQWSIVDLPYPDVKAPESMGGYTPSTEVQVTETIANWVKKTSPGRKHEVTQLRIEGPKASARVLLPDKTWLLRLERVGEEWRVVER
jgi:hypothetical protein